MIRRIAFTYISHKFYSINSVFLNSNDLLTKVDMIKDMDIAYNALKRFRENNLALKMFVHYC